MALKHGRRSKKAARAREESYAFEERLHKWMSIDDAQNDMEEYLIYRNVCLSFDLDRTESARLERRTSLIENSDEAELLEIDELGKRLFFDPSGASPLYGNRKYRPSENKTSWNGLAVDPDDPAVLVKKMESTAAGCEWLQSRWRELLGLLDTMKFWQSLDRLKAARLLGRQPVDVIEDVRVAQIFVASHALHGGKESEFADLLSDMEEEQHVRYRKAVRERFPELFRAREAAEWKQILVDLAERNIERLNAKLEVLEENADAIDQRTFDRLNFDPTPEGDALRNYEMKCTNALFRGMENYRKYKARRRDGWSGPGGMERYDRGRDRSMDAGRGARESEGPKVGPVHSYAWGEGERERRRAGGRHERFA